MLENGVCEEGITDWTQQSCMISKSRFEPVYKKHLSWTHFK